MKECDIQFIRDALNEIATWDCKGDSLKDAYDYVHRAGEWNRLLNKLPHIGGSVFPAVQGDKVSKCRTFPK